MNSILEILLHHCGDTETCKAQLFTAAEVAEAY